MNDPQPTPETVEDRLSILEEENRSLKHRFRLMQGGLACLIVVLLMLGAVQGTDGSFRQLTVRKLFVCDNDGNNRVSIATAPDGTAVQVFLDKDGKPGVSIGTKPDGTAWQGFHDKDGEARISIGTRPDGTAGQIFCDKDGKARISIATQADGTTGQVFLDKDEKPQITSQRKPTARRAGLPRQG